MSRDKAEINTKVSDTIVLFIINKAALVKFYYHKVSSLYPRKTFNIGLWFVNISTGKTVYMAV